MDARQGASRKNEAQENSAVVEPMIVQLDFNKKRAKANIKLTRKRVKRQASKAYRKIANPEEENKQLHTGNLLTHPRLIHLYQIHPIHQLHWIERLKKYQAKMFL